MQRLLSLAVAALLASLCGPVQAADPAGQVDSKLPEYKKVASVSGRLKSVGSDTMNNLMTLWGEGFKKEYPNVDLEVEGKGSNSAPPALIEGTATFGPMSREMKKAEIDEFKKKKGYEPVGLATSLDVLALYVHKDNPIARTGLTLEQVDAIFSKNRKAGHPKDLRTWGDVGLTGAWTNEPIRLYGRNAASGTYVYFKEQVLKNGDYKDTTKEQPGSSAVVQGIAADRFAIGYSGIGYKTADVSAVPLARKAGDKFLAPSLQTAEDYPLARFLYVYLDYKPNTELDALRREFLRFVFSKQGQLAVVKDGYLPLSAADATEALKQVGLAK